MSGSLGQIDGLGEESEERMPCTCMCVDASVSWRCFMSTSNPNCQRKSAPSDNENPREGSAVAQIESERSLTVRRDRSVVHCHKGELVLRSEREGGMTLTSDPVSTRKCVPVCVSFT